MKKMSDNYSVSSSLLNDDQLLIKRKKENYAILIGILSQAIWGINGVQMKAVKPNFLSVYDDDSLLFWRMIIVGIIGYIRCKMKNVHIQRHSELKNLKWFLIRNGISYIFIMFWVKELSYFRISTISVFGGSAPLVIIIMSTLILKEKFYMRYVYGVILCIIGSTIIILNDRKPSAKAQILNDNTFIGILLAIGNISLYSLSTLGQKVLTTEKMDIDLQNFYFGMYTGLPAGFFCLLKRDFGFRNLKYVLFVASNGIVFFLGNYTTTLSLKYINLSKFQPLTYLCIVFTFIFSFLLIGEPIFFTDIIGAVIICGFLYYNIKYPPGKFVNTNIINNK